MNLGSRALVSMRNTLPITILSIMGAIPILLATKNYGAGLTPDSVGYIATARHIASGIGVVTYDGAPLIDQPPLYPVLLATVAYFSRTDPRSIANIVNAVLFGLIVYLAGLLFLKFSQSSVAFALVGTTSITVSIPLVAVSLMAWSEPLFICFVLLYVVLFESYRAKVDTRSMVLLSLSVALACLTRYIGVILILTGILGILAFCRPNLRARIGHLVLFVSISALPIGMWIMRNYVISGTLFGPRASSIHSLSQNLSFMFNTLVNWYVPGRIREHRSMLMLTGAIAGFLAGLSAREKWSKVTSFLSEVGPVVLLTVAYVGFLLVSSTNTAYDEIGDRLLSPVFVPITLLLLLIAAKILTSVTNQWMSPKRVHILLAAATVLWLVYPTRAAVSSIVNAMTRGQGYSSESWRRSQTIEYLRQNRTVISECAIYSNAPDALYILAHLTAKWSPAKTRYNSPEIVVDMSTLRASWPRESKSCLVWFDNIERKYLYSLDELRRVSNMQPIIRTKDGGIYSVARE